MLLVPNLRRALQEIQPHRALPRRVVLASLAGLAGILPVWAMPGSPEIQAKKRKNKNRKKRNKPEKNAFGCLNVGQRCNGKDSQCCSGVCDGKKPKKGKKDTSKCAAHNVNLCEDAFDLCLGIEVPCGLQGACVKTTGNAPFCAGGTGECRPCQRDTDCVNQGFGFNAACVVCDGACASLSGGTVCFSAAG